MRNGGIWMKNTQTMDPPLEPGRFVGPSWRHEHLLTSPQLGPLPSVAAMSDETGLQHVAEVSNNAEDKRAGCLRIAYC
jgi:hypothetical protein